MTLKKILFISIIALLTISSYAFNGDEICGYWRTLKGNTQLEIYKTSQNTYEGKVVWLRIEKDRPDFKNPDKNLRDRKVLGLTILKNLEFSSQEQKWINGVIYDPESGNTYECQMYFKNDKDILYLKGHIKGYRLLSRETIWIREKHLRQ